MVYTGMNKLEELIKEGKELYSNIEYVELPHNVIRTYDEYDIVDKERYFLWVNRTKQLLNKNYISNPLVREFIDLSKGISPDNHLQMVSILETLLDDYHEEIDTKQVLEELERLEREYVKIKDHEGGGVQFYAIQHFHEWFEFAIKVFYNAVGENDSNFEHFKTANISGNSYVLSHVYDTIHASYVILKEKVKNPPKIKNQIHLDIPVVEDRTIKHHQKTNIFISYSHQDKKYLDRLLKHLKVFQKQNNNYEVWSDKKINLGDKWKNEIEEALSKASVALLLVSTDFLASDFVVDEELPKLLRKSSAEGTLMIPIILSPCLFEDSQLGEFQAINSPEEPLTAMTEAEQDQVFVNLLKQLKNRF